MSNDKELVFGHGGEYGDMIYALPAIAALGGGHLRLQENEMTRVRADGRGLNNIEALMKQQPCIKSFRLRERNEPVDIDLDRFRELFFADANLGRLDHMRKMMSGTTLVSYHMQAAHLPLNHKFEIPWLTCHAAQRAKAKSGPHRVVICRTMRYINRHFDWEMVARHYGDHAIFVGDQDEYTQFYVASGGVLIPRIITDNLYSVAQLINAADLFIGNQSACLAIAHGLGKRCLVAAWERYPTSVFDHPNFTYWHKQKPKLPEI